MKFLNPPFYIYFFIHIKISETFLSKHYQDKKKNDFKKKLAKKIKIFLGKKKKKGNNMVMHVTKISQRMKNKAC